MKVYEVRTERTSGIATKQIEEIVQYVSAEDLVSVASHFAIECEQIDEELKSVREVLTVSQNIDE